ncbi:hypothetical protein EDB19DRAFT_853573 [Suillus lakei]|nr:hypothetical protein EDB19DRAFT_853573 [Suillus lakei]
MSITWKMLLILFGLPTPLQMPQGPQFLIIFVFVARLGVLTTHRLERTRNRQIVAALRSPGDPEGYLVNCRPSTGLLFPKR